MCKGKEVQIMEEEKRNQEQKAVEFLIAEYEQIFEEFRRVREEGINRLNFFITITSSILGGLLLISQISPGSTTFLQFVALGVLLFLLLIGWEVFRFAISRDVNTDFNLRAMARIRRFFVAQNPSIKKHLSWGDDDEPTAWITSNSSNIRRIVQAILSLLFSLTVGLVVDLLSNALVLSIVFGALAFSAAWLFLRAYSARKFNKASKIASQSVRFPKG
jgi:hypothetical protein